MFPSLLLSANAGQQPLSHFLQRPTVIFSATKSFLFFASLLRHSSFGKYIRVNVLLLLLLLLPQLGAHKKSLSHPISHVAKEHRKKRWRLKYTRSALQLKVSVPNPKFGPGYNILQKFTQMCSSQIWLQYFAKMHRCCCLRLIILPRRIVSVIQALSVTVTSVRVTIRLQCQLFVPKRIFLS